MNKYRDNGAIGALLDEYEKSILELKEVISQLTKQELITIVDTQTKDEDCRSIQTILSHVVKAGYIYVISIRKWLGEEIEYRNGELLNTIPEYQLAIDEMFEFNIQLFEDHPNLQMEEHDSSKKINARWGPQYDVEQLMEHAIVHVLRHRRQIERFILKLRK